MAPHNMQLNSDGCRSLAPRGASPDRFYQRLALQRGRLTGCYVPIVMALATFFSPVSYAEFDWFEGVWVSDSKQTMKGADWEKLKEDRPDLYQKMAEQYGKTQWTVRGGVIEGTAGGYEFSGVTYSYRPTSKGTVEVLHNDGAAYEVVRTNEGFCLKYPTDSALSRECFKRAGT